MINLKKSNQILLLPQSAVFICIKNGHLLGSEVILSRQMCQDVCVAFGPKCRLNICETDFSANA